MCFFFSFPLPTKQGEPTKNTCNTVTVGHIFEMNIRIEESWFVILGIPMDDFKLPKSEGGGVFES